MTQQKFKMDDAVVAAMLKAREIGVKMLASDCEAILKESGLSDGISVALKYLRNKVEEYDREYARQDYETGAWEFGSNAQEEYSNSMHELIEEIESLESLASAPEVDGEAVAWVKYRTTQWFGTANGIGEFSFEKRDDFKYPLYTTPQPSSTAELEEETIQVIGGKYPKIFVNSEEAKADYRRIVALLRDHFLRKNADHCAELEDKVKRLEAVETMITELTKFADIKINKVKDGYLVSVFPNNHAPLWWYKIDADLVSTLRQALTEGEILKVHVLPEDTRALLAEIGGGV